MTEPTGTVNGQSTTNTNTNSSTNDNAGSKYYPEDEVKKLIEQRDKLKQERRELRSKIQELEKQMHAFEKFKSRIEEYDELVAQLEAYKQKEEEMKKKQMDEVERLKFENQKLLGEIEKLRKELEHKIDIEEYQSVKSQLEEKLQKERQYLDYKLRSDIISLATRYNAINPEQIYLITKHFFKLNEDGEFVVEERTENGGVIELTPEEYIKKFLSAPENANLIKQEKRTGREEHGDDVGGTGKGNISGSSSKKYNLTPADKRRAASMGLSEEEYYEIVIVPRERKLGKVENAQ